MAQKYLTSGSYISCNKGSLSSSILATNSTATIEGRKIILDNDITFKPFGICKILTSMAQGIETPCRFVYMGDWKNTKDDITHLGRRVVLDTSELYCAIGGIIKPDNSKNRSVSTSASSANISKKSTRVSQNKSIQDNIKIDYHNNSSHSKDNKKETEENIKCYWDNQNIEFKNDASLLRVNMKNSNSISYSKEVDYIKSKYKELMGLKYDIDSGIYVAHHLISGNQIFRKFPIIVKKALASDYDINNEKNGILLPTLSKQIRKRLKFENRKVPVAFEVMQKVKKQWHLGGHSYKIDFDKSDNSITLKNYVDSVSELMINLEISWENLNCKERTKTQDNRINNDLNSLSLKIAKHLNRFSVNPKYSYPFYVSKVAMMYAFNIEENINFVAFEVLETNQIVAIIFKYKKKNRQLTVKREAKIPLNNPISFIKFVANIKTFVTYNNRLCKSYKPFKELEESIYIDKYPKETLFNSIKRNVFTIIEKAKNNSFSTRDLIRARIKELEG